MATSRNSRLRALIAPTKFCQNTAHPPRNAHVRRNKFTPRPRFEFNFVLSLNPRGLGAPPPCIPPTITLGLALPQLLPRQGSDVLGRRSAGVVERSLLWGQRSEQALNLCP